MVKGDVVEQGKLSSPSTHQNNSHSRRLASDEENELTYLSGPKDEYVGDPSDELEEDELSDEDVLPDYSAVGSRQNSSSKAQERERGRGTFRI